MGLRVSIGIFRTGEFSSFCIYIVMSLRRSIYTVCPMKPCIKPLWTIRSGHLCSQHVGKLVVENFCICFTIKIIILPSPISPAPCEAVEHLTTVYLMCKTLLFGQVFHCCGIRYRSLQPRWYSFFSYFLKNNGNARFPEIFLGYYIGCYLRPSRWYLYIFHMENFGAIWVLDLRGSTIKF